MLTVRHVGVRNLNQVAPSGMAYRSRQGDVVQAHDETDYNWLLSLRIRACGCGSPSPNGHGNPLFESYEVPLEQPA